MSPTAPVPEPSSTTDRRLSVWAPSPENPGVSRYLERTMAASQTTQPTPPEPYCCSRNTVPSLFSKSRTKFRNGSSTEHSRVVAIAARQQDAARIVTSYPRAPAPSRLGLERGSTPPSGGIGTLTRVRRHKARKAALPGRGRVLGHLLPLRAGVPHAQMVSLVITKFV